MAAARIDWSMSRPLQSGHRAAGRRIAVPDRSPPPSCSHPRDVTEQVPRAEMLVSDFTGLEPRPSAVRGDVARRWIART
jgi:hypothetical protein